MAAPKGMHSVPGVWNIKVGTHTEVQHIKVGEKPHEDPLVEGLVAVYEDVPLTSWEVYIDDGDTLIISRPDKEDVRQELGALINELIAARDLLETL